jgi:hypothetical protein
MVRVHNAISVTAMAAAPIMTVDPSLTVIPRADEHIQ